jgi:hypothetical protein
VVKRPECDACVSVPFRAQGTPLFTADGPHRATNRVVARSAGAFAVEEPFGSFAPSIRVGWATAHIEHTRDCMLEAWKRNSLLYLDAPPMREPWDDRYIVAFNHRLLVARVFDACLSTGGTRQDSVILELRIRRCG